MDRIFWGDLMDGLVKGTLLSVALSGSIAGLIRIGLEMHVIHIH